ncbi:MAG: phosphoadenylyl-sulfate reductase [Candidatus Hydrogenedens sp.]|nr:phosphoadenylyl-sulfate reductase [Candidatus Hydrogenedens sp.]
MVIETTEKDLYEELRDMGPEDMFRWALAHHGPRAGIVTSFQDTGCVMIDMMSKVAPGLRVMTVDTLRLHEETYALMREVEQRYGLTVERFTPDPARLKRMVAQHGEYLFFDDKAKQEYCCKIRKVEPNDAALETLDVWFTGLRRDHSEFRQETPKAQLINRNGRKLLKLAPLADWDKERIDAYSEEHGVPKNALYEKGYTSIGCVICTTPTLPHEHARAGRWRWFNYLDEDNKECGIHIGGSGI